MEINVVLVDGNGGKKGVLLLKGVENGVGLVLERGVFNKKARIDEYFAISDGYTHFYGKMRWIGNGLL